jgi:prevent-host-death family protein
LAVDAGDDRRRRRQVDTFHDQWYHLTMKRIAAAKFKEQCLSLLDRVDAEGIVITKRGKPVAKLVPIRSESAELIGRMKGRIKIKGSILATGLDWDAES